ncbi:putative E3 ubiquitin ligase protein [Dioscorea alata]|uniref:E3 ubiquitin ligase protein n=1 Tax=Dioscorea alata TaxID=55571 RepID=A0ACB7W664_DIOAL|nr:putative E3 ubiquitin ligase protein [Dioscorea alata]
MGESHDDEDDNGGTKTLFDIIHHEGSSGTRRPGLKDNLHVEPWPHGGTGDRAPTPRGAPALARNFSARTDGVQPQDPPVEEPPAEEPVTISLMALLEQSGRFGGDDDEDEESPMAEEEDEEGGGEMQCCVCMVRHKGAAFIPCGHTFCRLCSRELWASRGNCPLCNGFILEILDIF